MPALEDKTFLWLIIAVSLAFALILWPFFGAVLWGVVLSIVFAPLCRRLTGYMHRRRTLAAIATLLIILVMVILPVALIITALVEEASGVYEKIQAGELNFGKYFQQVFDALPPWASNLLERFGVANVGEVFQKASAGLMKASQFLASQAINIGQNTFDFILSLFVMLYLLFFLLRDGDELSVRVKNAVPLRPEQRQKLFRKFTIVVRATVKGTIVVAFVQGVLGGLIFWFLGINAPLLWGALMGIMSLLPAVGTGIVWVPVAVYLLATGSVWQGLVLIAFGVFVIGLVDNVLRPILVGKDTKMPDYVALISTLGGIAIFGINGFVIGPLIAAMFIATWDIFSESKAWMQ